MPPARPAGDPFEIGGAPVTARAVPARLPAPEGAALRGGLRVEADHPEWGGLSGLLVAPDGARFLAISDRGPLFSGRLERRDGALSGVSGLRVAALRGPDGRPRRPGWDNPEALALWRGGLAVAFEDLPPRIWAFGRPGGAARPLPLGPRFAGLPRNAGIEGLAASPDGALWALAEGGAGPDRPARLFRTRDGARWEEGRWPREDGFDPTGAEFGPDGALWVTERRLGLFGFRSRLRRADPADWPELRPRTVAAFSGAFDNLEAVALWRDAAGGLRVVLASDDNYIALQRTVIWEIAPEV